MWKKIKLIRKAFITNFIGVHYSQFGEDIVLRELLKKEYKKGFFVDVGCYHPKKFSNTYMLYKRGWNGINIDMEEDKISLFKMVRPRDYNILSAISDKKEIVSLYRFSQYGLGSTIDRSIALSTSDELFDIQTIQTKSLNDVIDASPFKGRQIDVLSIDAEGMDFRVLRSLDIDAYKPKIIIIESHYKSIQEILKSEIYELLSNYSYCLRSWTFYSLIFILPDSNILKDREILINQSAK